MDCTLVRSRAALLLLAALASCDLTEVEVDQQSHEAALPPAMAGPWIAGRRHAVEPGEDRLFVFSMHGYKEDDAPRPSYGGQIMHLLLERSIKRDGHRTVTRVYYLRESELRKVRDDQIRLDGSTKDVRWANDRAHASVFLFNVDQDYPFADKDTASTDGREARCHRFANTDPRDLIITAATAAKRGTFSLGGSFFDDRELSLGSHGDGVVGTMQGTGGHEAIAVRHTNPGAIALACAHVNAKPRYPSKLRFTAVTFNTGTTAGEADGDGYSDDDAELSDQYYGDGLAWQRSVNATRAFFAGVRPDIVGFQEMFYSENCASIPSHAHREFVCEHWRPGDPTVAQVVLGAGYQVACHKGKDDKCIGVKRRFGTIRGCDGDLCMDFLAGSRIKDCGGGARVGRAVIDLVGGGSLSVVNMHGSSGVSGDDIKCRVQQLRQVFENIGDGDPGANGRANVILGDFNTDPGRLALIDNSARRLDKFVDDDGFTFTTDKGFDAEPTYSGLFNIDHVISDAFKGSCWHAGITGGHPQVSDVGYFDHVPAVCRLSGKRPK